MTDSVAIVSGGMDSVTLLHHLVKEKNLKPHVLSFNYGQRHRKELRFARDAAAEFGLQHHVIDLSGITHLISNSALTSPYISNYDVTGLPSGPVTVTDRGTRRIEVPEGHYAEDSMKLTVVPNRNMIMLSIAAGVAVNEKANLLAIGVHAGDHFIYPDCRPRFIHAANAAIVIGNEGFGAIGSQPEGACPDEFIYAPFINKSKEDIARLGNELDVNWSMTWSCYAGGSIHCGRCGTCVERLEALSATEANDQTEYEDSQYWKTQVGN